MKRNCITIAFVKDTLVGDEYHTSRVPKTKIANNIGTPLIM